ncbi:DNA polymerase III subunit chi [Legionella jamestowniensis]|uniref:DNA polymerase III subunit chi n=1 Tax=Legionella jamestowniensis TaxID=455 RepID=A0A0W0ULC1_9GAMM|nr:DNA polymerase III subunit chi [Legionella jamestowniensis]KTD08702.1 DNA polymerase III subunit chi [Legionella jamestowniensis]OCH96859.1 DNA polymerase III subunit chi [Legionella jamestowniensis]SFL55248.1 DNA polymerase III, chi subunit [Legionella jamestowniensis DSM 19215]
MPAIRVDFYLLNSQDEAARWLLACRLLEKAYLRGHRVFVHCESQKDAHELDELLWTFKDNSFIPHNLQGEGPEPPPPIQIGYQAEPRGYSDILLNLNSTIPEFYKRFKRVMEIVVNDETAKELSRKHYKKYRTHQCELHTHNME